MPYVLIVHEVDDYATWKRVFDEAAGLRKAAGEVAFRLLREQTSATSLVHFSEWADLAAARAFFESDELVEIRRKAGVHPPTFLYLEQLEAGTL